MATGVYPSTTGTQIGQRERTTTCPSNLSRSPPGGGVGFHIPQPREGYMETRKNYLTAKYGVSEMKLVRKRIAVEGWLHEQLQTLYQVSEDDDDYDCLIDLDDVLELEDDQARWLFLQDQVSTANQTPEVVDNFIREVLERVQTLQILHNSNKSRSSISILPQW